MQLIGLIKLSGKTQEQSMTNVGRYQQVKPVAPLKKTTDRKTPLSQPGVYNQKVMEGSKAIYSGNSNDGKY